MMNGSVCTGESDLLSLLFFSLGRIDEVIVSIAARPECTAIHKLVLLCDGLDIPVVPKLPDTAKRQG